MTRLGLPPITVTLSAENYSISLDTLVHTILRQLELRLPTHAEEVDHQLMPYNSSPVGLDAHQQLLGREVADLRSSIMVGTERHPTEAEVMAAANKRTLLVALNARLQNGMAAGEEMLALKQTFEMLRDEFRRDERARHISRDNARKLVSASIRALLDEDIATGRLVRHSKDECEYVKIDDLVRWAEYRNVVVQQERQVPTVLIRRTSAGDQVNFARDVPALPDAPWLIKDPRDDEPDGFQPWYTSARYFARQEVRADATLLAKRDLLAARVAKSLAAAGIFKRGKAKKALDPATVKKAFVNVHFG